MAVTSYKYSQWSKCCLFQNCAGEPPLELTAVADLSGSCPEAANNILTVTVSGSTNTCDDLCSGAACDAFMSWIIDDADRLTCQPFMDHIFVQCRDDNGLPLAEGCDHVRY